VLIRVLVNGEWREADVWPGSSLLSMLREELGLSGSKNACEQGECGSCSVWLDGELVCSCLVLAAQAHEHEVQTVESLARDDVLHPVQAAFLEAGAVQCGFCTPGMLMNAYAMLLKNPKLTRKQIIDGMEMNLCRCSAHTRIVKAIESVSKG